MITTVNACQGRMLDLLLRAIIRRGSARGKTIAIDVVHAARLGPRSGLGESSNLLAAQCRCGGRFPS
jgi:hypothetical protein